MPATVDNMPVANDDFYNEDEEVVEEDLDHDDNLEDNFMEIDLEEKLDVKSLKNPPGPPSSVYSPSEENILISYKQRGKGWRRRIRRPQDTMRKKTVETKHTLEDAIKRKRNWS